MLEPVTLPLNRTHALGTNTCNHKPSASATCHSSCAGQRTPILTAILLLIYLSLRILKPAQCSNHPIEHALSIAERVPLERETPRTPEYNPPGTISTVTRHTPLLHPPGSARKRQPSHRLHTSLDQRSLIPSSTLHLNQAARQGKEDLVQPRSCLQKQPPPRLRAAS